MLSAEITAPRFLPSGQCGARQKAIAKRRLGACGWPSWWRIPMASYSRLSALDRSFLDIEDRNTNTHVGATCVFDVGPLRAADGGIDIERVRAYVESRLHLIPRYRQRLAHIPLEGHPVWVDDSHFDI